MVLARVNRGQFLSQLESVKAGLSPREILEQSSCIIFGEGRVATYNDQVACSAHTGLEPRFKGAIQAGPLLTILGKLKEEELDIELGDGEFIIKGVKRSAGLRVEKDVVLPVKSVELPKEWKPLHSEFSEAVQVVSQCAGKDSSQFQLVCVHIHPKWLEASDNFQVCRWKMKTGVSQPQLVRHTDLRSICGLGMVEFGETDSWLHFRNASGVVYSCRRHLDDFPDVSGVLEVTGEKVVLPKTLAEEAELASIFSEDNSEHKLVLVQLKPGKLRIRSSSASGWYNARSEVVYKGPPMEFLVSPKMLIDLLKRHTECTIAPERLKVTANGYTYVSCLSVPPEEPEKTEKPVPSKKKEK